MNRRDFIGAAIGALVAALLLPFEEFAAWCAKWFGEPPRQPFQGIDRELFAGMKVIVDRFVPRGVVWGMDQHGRNTVWVHPDSFEDFRAFFEVATVDAAARRLRS